MQLNIFSLTDFRFWIYFVYFFFGVFVAFFIPGNIFIRQFRIGTIFNIVLSIILGMVLWGYQGILFGYLQMRWLSYIYLFVLSIIWIFKNRSTGNIKIKLNFRNFLKDNKYFLIVFLIGFLIQMEVIFFTGIKLHNGIFYCCNGPDVLYHIALTSQIQNAFPPFEPGAYSEIVKNYYYFSNMIVADLVRVFHLPLVPTFSQYMGTLISAFLGLSVFAFGIAVKVSKRLVAWITFFVYFSGNAVYLLILFVQKKLDIHISYLYDATQLWISPPRLYALVFLFGGLALFALWQKNKKVSTALLVCLIWGALVGTKVYVGLFILAGMSCLFIYYFLQRRLKDILSYTPLFIISSIFYFSTNSGSGGIFFSGFWRVEDFIVFPEFNLSHLELARRVYLEHGNIIHMLLYDIFFTVLYFIVVFGTLNISLFQTKGSLSKINKELHIVLIGAITICMAIGFFSLQETGGANSSQFIITVMGIVSIYAGLAADYWTGLGNKKILGLILVIIIIAFTVPTPLSESYLHAKSLITGDGGFLVPENELKAMSYLQTIPSSAVLLTGRYDCIYIDFMINKSLFSCNDGGVLTDHKVNHTQGRFIVQDIILKNGSRSKVSSALVNSNIDYIYLSARQEKIHATSSANFLPMVVKNENVTLYKVSKDQMEKYLEMHRENPLIYE